MSKLFGGIIRALRKERTMGWALRNKSRRTRVWEHVWLRELGLEGGLRGNRMSTRNAGESLVHHNSMSAGSCEKSSQEVKFNYSCWGPWRRAGASVRHLLHAWHRLGKEGRRRKTSVNQIGLFCILKEEPISQYHQLQLDLWRIFWAITVNVGIEHINIESRLPGSLYHSF